VRRFVNPTAIVADTMFKVALLGLVVNVIAFVILHGGDRENLNIRGAALHVAGDLLGSVAAIVASVVILYTGIVLVDPVLSIAVAFLILRSAWMLVKRSAHVLLQGSPDWLDTAVMQTRIVAAVPMVKGIHHVHVWGLTPQDLILTMHVELDGGCTAPTEQIRRVKSLLADEYGIGHSTIEIEFEECADRDGRGC
jgi:cobalt-zinc-cadmium efflux system protein